ncbi:hypothetical protein GCM10029976_027500 [Kribbella albertanoniae]|uniref:PH domain-containing protein n=1 Tax=Kribbella albertanoniae TaxID=1266829 RepID=A0A4R4P345_9ACTN|nr:hypothetical protein [Kribbella albertanoniae]TDC15153.1 hypothetical protein E1261_40860 [Kribbella albertanoniae]
MAETDVLVLRPGTGPRRQVYRIVAAISGAFVIAGFVNASRAKWIFAISCILFLVVTVAVYLRVSRIVVTPTEISARGLTFHRRRDRALAAGVIRATVVQPGAVSESIIICDATGYALLTINGALYSAADRDKLVWYLGLPTNVPGQPLSFVQLSRQVPGSVSWAGRHPFWVIVLCTVGFAVIALGGGTLLWLLTK